MEVVVVVMFMVEVQRTDSNKQLERLLVCLRPSECIEGLFSVSSPLERATVHSESA